MEFGNILNWFKLDSKYLIAIVIITSFFIFSSDELLTIIGFLEIKKSYLTWFGLAFIISISLLISHFLEKLYFIMKRKWIQRQDLSRWQNYIHELTPEEKKVLKQYIENNTRTQPFSLTNGVISGLVANKILAQSTNIGGMDLEFSFYIQQWAWQYINKKPELVN